MSQLDPLPRDLPFRIISKTIGRGAYASIKKAIPPVDSTPIFAVKFIHKAYAVKHGRISAKQIAMEVSLHSHIGQHPNIIEWFATGEDDVWKWIAMEYAEGGDLFDKIEADVGVSEDIAHLYFSQLISGVCYMHAKGVAHRDIKPENILLSETGSLKIADFGLATLFMYQGNTKLSTTMCGSPPYIAPEVIKCSKGTQSKGGVKASGYAANMCDIWSCGVVLFVLLVGNTPWDEPTEGSWEFQEFTGKRGHSEDELWKRLPKSVLSLLRGMMNVDCSQRFNFQQIKAHPWFTRKNPLLSPEGKMKDQIIVATKMLEGLHIDFSQQPTVSQRSRQGQDAMEIDSGFSKFAFTQPEAPINDVSFDWERPPRANAAASQPTDFRDSRSRPMPPSASLDHLADEPSMSQFAVTPTVPYSLTQNARLFREIIPNYSLTRFFSHLSAPLLLHLLGTALHQLNIRTPPISQMSGREHQGWIRIKTVDGRMCGLAGDIVVDSYVVGETELLEVRFVKVKGDPLEWRRFFKNVTVLCKEGVYVPGT